ncbi:Fatty acid-binding protein DegV [Kibdelosporangium sp. 4NS15]|uniref:Fatty acid-binding protein DegV n=1 Tax=Kibdelosporangium persicum TaxID=2698649 RepID=A0ABX2FAG6_9PSEU|nr:DegV family protein [Kibdelosporangium persicum]NRN68349.1 Fatty acid-binding protein DegV [Kibdelosporangium persicum]
MTDSTACLPADLARQWGVSIAQIQIRIGDQVAEEQYVPADHLISAMRNRTPVTTAPPEPATFYRLYQQVAQQADAIVSIHVSSRLSETCKAASRAAGQMRIPVHIVDSATCGMSLGYAVLAAARVAGAGGNPRRVIDAAVKRCRASSELIYVDTLEYLRRGGRIGAAAALVGSALSLKPVLTVQEGQIAPQDKGFGSDRALRKMVDTAVSRAGEGMVDIAVEHFGNMGRATTILEELKPRLNHVRDAVITEVSSSIGVHVGPGAVGITVSRAE